MIFNVTNGLVTRNVCVDNRFGIYVAGNPPRISHHNTVSYNNCSDNRDYGIYVIYSHDNILANNTCNNNPTYGIAIDNSDRNVIYNNTCSGSNFGIYNFYSDDTTMTNNICSGNGEGINVIGSVYATITNNKLLDNTVRGLLLKGSSQYRIRDNLCVNNERHIHIYDYGGYPIVNNTCVNGSNAITLRVVSTATIVANNTCINNIGQGIYLWDSDNHLIVNNTLEGNSYGIYIRESRYVDIINNTLIDNMHGTYFNNGDLCPVRDNNFKNNTNGAVLKLNSNSNNFAYNTISDSNDYGMLIEASVGNVITNNTFNGNTNGISVDSLSYSNTLVWNSFIDSLISTEDNGSTNDFDYNYWSDYSGPDVNGDGIGDDVYLLSGSAMNNDSHPLMLPPGSLPIWLQEPSNRLWVPENPFSYDLNATAPPPGLDEWWLDDTVNFQISNIGIVTNITSLVDGTYPLQVWVNDTQGNIITDIFTVTVETESPYWIETPIDQICELGTSFIYDLNATDTSGLDTWWLNDTTHFYITSGGVIRNVSLLSIGIYGLQVWVNDTYGRVLTASFDVLVEDTTSPIWLELPTDQFLEHGDSFLYALTANDLSGIAQWWVNDTVHFTIDGSGVLTNAVPLQVGIYWLEVRALDPFDNYCTEVFRVSCLDTVAPSWVIQPSDQFVEFGNEFVCDLDAIDSDGIHHYWVNDTDHFSIDSEGLVLCVPFLDVGVYWLEVVAYDSSQNNCTAIIRVTVADTTAPEWVEVPVDQVIGYGLDLSYDLNAMDLSEPLVWSVDDTVRFYIDWQGRLRNNILLSPGEYSIRVFVSDAYGNQLTAYLTVTVLDITTTTTTTTTTNETTTEGGGIPAFLSGIAVGVGAISIIIVVLILLRKRGVSS